MVLTLNLSLTPGRRAKKIFTGPYFIAGAVMRRKWRWIRLSNGPASKDLTKILSVAGAIYLTLAGVLLQLRLATKSVCLLTALSDVRAEILNLSFGAAVRLYSAG